MISCPTPPPGKGPCPPDLQLVYIAFCTVRVLGSSNSTKQTKDPQASQSTYSPTQSATKEQLLWQALYASNTRVALEAKTIAQYVTMVSHSENARIGQAVLQKQSIRIVGGSITKALYRHAAFQSNHRTPPMVQQRRTLPESLITGRRSWGGPCGTQR